MIQPGQHNHTLDLQSLDSQVLPTHHTHSKQHGSAHTLLHTCICGPACCGRAATHGHGTSLKHQQLQRLQTTEAAAATQGANWPQGPSYPGCRMDNPPSAQYPRAAIGWPVREVTILQCWHQEHALSCAVTRCASAGTHCKPPAGQDATVWITLWLNKPSHGVDLLAPRAAAVCCQALAGPPGLNAFHTQQSVTPVAAPGAPHASPAGQVPSSCVD
jgi:hypothetical protein